MKANFHVRFGGGLGEKYRCQRRQLARSLPYWLHAFTDHDGQEKVLAWRSPNQVGEYVILQPTADSDIPEWVAPNGSVTRFPEGDSRRLPPRVDHLEPDYLGLVDPEASIGVGETYHIDSMDGTIAQAQANRGALGQTCNSLMVHKAAFGGLPEQPPAPLEDVIDRAVKTGADLSLVVDWNYEHSRQLLESGTAVPAILHERLSIDYLADPPLPRPRATKDHWLDRTVAGIEEHIRKLTAVRDEMAAQVRPPLALLDAAFADPETIQIGGGLNQAFAAVLSRKLPPIPEQAGKRLSRAEKRAIQEEQRQERFERARQAAWDYLHRYHPNRHSAILRGAMVSALLEGTSDAAAWLPGEKTANGRLTGIGHKSVQALQEIGVLGQIQKTDDGLVLYPALVAHDTDYTIHRD